MTGLRLDDCGDLLGITEYSAWMLQTEKATYNQLHRGGLLVQPHTLKPRPMWKRSDCEANLQRKDLANSQRAHKVRSKLRAVRAS